MSNKSKAVKIAAVSPLSATHTDSLKEVVANKADAKTTVVREKAGKKVEKVQSQLEAGKLTQKQAIKKISKVEAKATAKVAKVQAKAEKKIATLSRPTLEEFAHKISQINNGAISAKVKPPQLMLEGYTVSVRNTAHTGNHARFDSVMRLGAFRPHKRVNILEFVADMLQEDVSELLESLATTLNKKEAKAKIKEVKAIFADNTKEVDYSFDPIFVASRGYAGTLVGLNAGSIETALLAELLLAVGATLRAFERDFSPGDKVDVLTQWEQRFVRKPSEKGPSNEEY